MNQEFIKKSGQEMYFDKDVASKMIERENNASHILTSKIFEANLLLELKGQRDLVLADLGAGAHTMRYRRLIEYLKGQGGKIYWVDQSPFMLDYAIKNTPSELKDVFEFTEEEMVSFLKKHKAEFDGLILKYSFNYIISCSLEEWLKLMYESLKQGGKVVANQYFYEEDGMRERSHNAIFEIDGGKIKSGYKPKNNEIIEVLFLKEAGDQSSNPETFAETKTVYYSPAYIKSTARKAGFRRVEIYDDWSENKKWQELFVKLNPEAKIKPKSFIFFEK